MGFFCFMGKIVCKFSLFYSDVIFFYRILGAEVGLDVESKYCSVNEYGDRKRKKREL